jgi:PAS domain S-box-containing protein/putative nucleotidyltransferase with HDIG domain
MNNKPVKVLYIEDNPGDVGVARKLLAGVKDARFDLEDVNRLSIGLNRLAEGSFDVILLDLGLPDSEGLKTFTTLFAHAGHIPVIVLTGSYEEALGIEAVREGAQDYLFKDNLDRRSLSRSILFAIERKRSEEALKESEKRYATLVEAALEGIIIVDADENVKYTNAAFAETLGYSVKELLRTNIAQLVSPKQFKIVSKETEKRRKGETSTYEIEFSRKDGTPRSFLAFSAPLFGSEREYEGSYATLLDITERKKTEEALRESEGRLRKSLYNTIYTLSKVVETRDPYTYGHQARVADLARAIAKRMDLPREQIELIYIAAVIHDIGKISVPSEILNKPGQLTEHEFNLIKSHPQIGCDILGNVEFPWAVKDVIIQHHERLDGSGYPGGLAGNDIILEARILGTADVVEAMSSDRPYRPALGIEAALDVISDGRSTLYDEIAVNTCRNLFESDSFSFNNTLPV